MSESINRRRALIVVAAVPAVAAAAGLMGIKVSTLIPTPDLPFETRGGKDEHGKFVRVGDSREIVDCIAPTYGYRPQ
ncbi:MAG: hypothetical protein WA717_11185, partial [Methyloceanibacter sp.]